MKKYYFLLFLSLQIFLFFSCRRPDITPAYIIFSAEDFKDCIENDLDKFNKIHSTDYTDREFEIIRLHNFRDVHISLNGTFLGYWQLPCTIPIKPDYSIKNNIRIIPCVRFINNTQTTAQYSFVKPIEKFIDIEREGEYRFSDLKFEYEERVSFPVFETFEQGTRFTSIDTIYGAPIEIFQRGDKSVGRIVLKDPWNYFKIATDYFKLLGQGVKQFWEITYRCDEEMATFLHFQKTSGNVSTDVVNLYATKGVTKTVYIDLTEIVSQVAGFDENVSVRLGISGIRNSDTATVVFDIENVKLITMRAPY